MLKDFRTFISRGNVIDMAVGIVIGVAFGAIVNSFVNDVLMPPIGLLLGDSEFKNLFVVLREGAVAGPYASLADAQRAGAVSINYGVFINTVVNFIILAAVVFFFLIRPVAKMYERQKTQETALAPNTKECPYCFSKISINAVKCPNCTSDLSQA